MEPSLSRKPLWIPDTNVILRYLLHDHEAHFQEANAFWKAVHAGQKEALVTEGVLMESVYVLQSFYKVPRSEIAHHLSALLLYPGILASDRDIFLSALDEYRYSSLAFVDCLLYVRHARAQGTVMSFDGALARRIVEGAEAEAET